MSNIFKSIVLAFSFSVAAIAADPLNTKCPVTTEAASPSVTSDYSKNVEFCCNRCKGQFDASPKAYMSAITKARRGMCPLSNKASVAGKSSVYKRTVALKDAAAKAKFDANPDQYIGLVR